jgi:dCMP deaminase
MVGSRSTCLRRRVGAVLVSDKRILTAGYNGPPSGIVHCAERGCLREEMGIPSGERHEICRGLHAEQNAIIQAALFGVSIKGSVLYCTTFPCIICTKMLINSGVNAIYYVDGYPDPLSMEMLKEAEVEIEQLPMPKGDLG